MGVFFRILTFCCLQLSYNLKEFYSWQFLTLEFHVCIFQLKELFFSSFFSLGHNSFIRLMQEDVAVPWFLKEIILAIVTVCNIENGQPVLLLLIICIHVFIKLKNKNKENNTEKRPQHSECAKLKYYYMKEITRYIFKFCTEHLHMCVYIYWIIYC